MEEFTTVGKRIPKWYANQLVTGEAKYATDAQMPGMLYAKVLRSRHPHARILKVDTSKAEKLHGVKAVVTAKDVPINLMGLCAFDRPIFASDKVRYIGDAIAAVAATDEDIAEEALSLIQVDYDVLPAVFDPMDSMRSDAPIIHEGRMTTGMPYFLNPSEIEAEITFRFSIESFTGTLKKGLLMPITFLKILFEPATKNIAPLSLMVESPLSMPLGKVTIWASIANPSRFGPQFAASIGLTMSKLRLLQTHTGGHFGCKSIPTIEPILALLTMKSRKPVKGVHTREEEFIASSVRHPL